MNCPWQRLKTIPLPARQDCPRSLAYRKMRLRLYRRRTAKHLVLWMRGCQLHSEYGRFVSARIAARQVQVLHSLPPAEPHESMVCGASRQTRQSASTHRKAGWDRDCNTIAKIEGRMRWVGDFELGYLAKALKCRLGDLVLEFPQQSDPHP